jgi:hypothetical protein
MKPGLLLVTSELPDTLMEEAEQMSRNGQHFLH